MIGAIAGDVIGSAYEGASRQDKHFPLFSPESRFTDDTVLSVAVAHAIRTDGDYLSSVRRWGRQYPGAGYGGLFHEWLFGEESAPYNSFGNGSAMRVSAVGWAFDDLDVVLREAARSAEISHNHPEGVKGAQAVAAAVFLARTGQDKYQMGKYLDAHFGYKYDVSLSEIWERGGFDVTCQGTVPMALAAFFYSGDFEDTVRTAVAFGGDTDTLAAIAGSIAEAHYGGVPAPIRDEVFARLDAPLREEAVAFAKRYRIPMEGMQAGAVIKLRDEERDLRPEDRDPRARNRLRSKYRPTACPKCGSHRILHIQYGLPDENMIRDAKAGWFALGGDLLMGEVAEWQCADCYQKIWKAVR